MDGLAALARRHPACASRIAEDVGFLVAAGATLAGAGRPGPGVVASVGAAARALVACARARPRATDLALRLEDDASESVALDAVDALLRATTAAAGSGSGKPSGETLHPKPSADASAFVVDTAVAAAAALEAIASRPLGADVVLAHPDVVPQLLALAAPPHPPRVAAAAAAALTRATTTSPPLADTAAADTLWSVDAVETLVRAIDREGGGGTRAEICDAVAASARLLATVAATAEDDESRDDVARVDGVLAGAARRLRNSDAKVVAAAATLVGELARTPAVCRAAQWELSAKNEEDGLRVGDDVFRPSGLSTDSWTRSRR